MWSVLLLLAPAQAGVADALFAPPDEDRDGVPDRTDVCTFLAETPNGYEDDDGCPDYLSSLLAVATLDGEVVDATLYAGIDRSSVRTANLALGLDGLVPGTHVALLADRDCLRGAERVIVGEAPTEVAVELEPVLDASLALDVRTSDGVVPERVEVRLKHARTPTCVPKGPLMVDTGATRLRVGRGTVRVTVHAAGYEPVTATVDVPEEATVPVPLVLHAKSAEA